MDFLPALSGVEDDAADFRTSHGLDVGIGNLVEVLPVRVFSGASGDQFDNCVVGSLDKDVFRSGVVDGCDGSVGMDWGVGQF